MSDSACRGRRVGARRHPRWRAARRGRRGRGRGRAGGGSHACNRPPCVDLEHAGPPGDSATLGGALARPDAAAPARWRRPPPMTSSSPPSIAELRAVSQPDGLLARNSGEHWAGRLYLRRLSPHVTRLLVATPISANGVTWLMVVAGLLAAGSLSLGGIGGALGALVLVPLQLLLHCCDGEVARWRGTSSPVGVYLDRVAHHLTEAALPVGLGVSADGGWGKVDGWTTIGLVVAVLVLLIKAESHLVPVARAEAGLPLVRDEARVAAPRGRGLARVRRALRFVPFFRVFVAIEATILALVAAVVDAVAGDHAGSRALLVALVAAGVVTAAGHLVAILASDRLR